jgi:uncharacterized protein (TIGR00725 family)
MARRPCIAVVGDGGAVPGSPHWLAAAAVGEALVDAGFRLVTGGMGGVMEAACLGARRARSYREGDTVALLPGHDPGAANAYADVVLPTGLAHARNALVTHADAVVAVGGGAGTLSEIALAWVHGRLVIAFRLPGWSGRVADAPLDDRRRFAGLDDDRIFGVDSAEEAIGLLRDRLEAYRSAAAARAR